MATRPALAVPRCRRAFLAIFVFGICQLLYRHLHQAWLHDPALRSRALRSRQQRPRQRSVALRAEDEDIQPLEITEDWREFRARLVQQESVEEGQAEAEDAARSTETKTQGWAHATPLIETGSLLLSAPGDHFSISQQYFHKTLIFIAEHTSSFTRGVILNRPTAFNTTDLEYVLGSDLPIDLLNTSDAWNVWCGGDCQGLNRRHDASDGVAYICLHTTERFARSSKQIIKGVFMIDLADAKKLVAAGEADKDDFLLLVGYCGWGPGQLQDEVDRGDTWTLAAADRQALLGRLQDAQASLSTRLEEAAEQRAKGMAVRPLSAEEVGDGLEEWRALYAALGPSFSSQVQDEQGDDVDVSPEHADLMLGRWIERCLIPPRYQAAAPEGTVDKVPRQLARGSILRGSAVCWLLGKPAERPSLERCFGQGLPGQYLHKAVLLLVRDHALGSRAPVLLVLLNGPQVGLTQQDDTPVFFGGPGQLGGQGVFELRGNVPYRFQGVISFASSDFEELLEMRALEVVEEPKELAELLAAPVVQRWELAGGQLDTLKEAADGKLGDMQQKLWYKQFFGIDFPPEV